MLAEAEEELQRAKPSQPTKEVALRVAVVARRSTTPTAHHPVGERQETKLVPDKVVTRTKLHTRTEEDAATG